MKKRILSLMLIFGILATLTASLPITVSAASSGICGENLTWTLDDNGTLTISGSGKMTDWSSNSSVPWYLSRTSIKSVIILNGVTSIGGNAFSWCDSLTSVTIPNSVTSIGNYAFYYCGSLTRVSIPDSVASIGDFAFGSCRRLTSITVDKDNTNYSSLDGNLFNKDKTILMQYAIGRTDKQYTIPDSVISIGSWAFCDCSRLTSVTILNSVTSIGNYAFSNFCSLTNVTIPNSVTSIGNYAFSYCNSLTSVKIPDGVTTIGRYAFYFCNSLTSVIIGDSVTSIGLHAFGYCSSLTSVTIPDSVTSIGNYAFEFCGSLTSVTIGSGVISIGDSSFGYCSSLTKITVNENNTNYSSYDGDLFNKDKTALIQYAIGKTDKQYTIPDGVTCIRDNAFYWCESLISVTIPGGVTSIGKDAFRDCRSLTSIKVDGDNTNYSSIDGNLFNKDKTALIQYAIGKTDKEYIIPSTVTSISSSAFEDCESLINVTIPNNVTCIGDNAFYWCENLTRVSIPAGVTSIGEHVFDNTAIYNNTENWEDDVLYIDRCLIQADRYLRGEYTIKENTRLISGRAFYFCSSLTNVTIPDSVTCIGENAFGRCHSLTGITVDKDNTNYSSYDGDLFNKDKTALIQYAIGKTDKQYIIPDDVTSIHAWTFRDCDSLTNVAIPDSVTSIGNGAFGRCSSLTSVKFPDGVTSIGDYEFEYCYSLTSVTIPNSVTSIGDSAFYGCDRLNTIYYAGTDEQWNSISIGSDNEELENATIEYRTITNDGNLKVIDLEITADTIEFYVEHNESSSDSVIYIGIYDNLGKLISIKSYPASESDRVRLKNEGKTLKVMWWGAGGMNALADRIKINLDN